MTPEQLKKASVLNQKIADNEEVLKSLRKSDAVIEEQKRPSTLVKLAYHQTDETEQIVAIDPQWFNSPELKSDFQHCVKIAKDGLIELLEKDLQLMKEESGKLK